MTTESLKTCTLTIPEIQEILGVDKDLDKSAIQEKLKNLKQYPKSIYSLDDLKGIYTISDETLNSAKQYVEARNIDRAKKAQATRIEKKAKIAKEKKKEAKLKPVSDFDELNQLYSEQARVNVDFAKISQQKNLLDKKIVELEKKMNVR